MAGIKNKEILSLLRDAIKESKQTQLKLSEELRLSPQFLSRLLNGHDPLSIDRAYEILRVIDISPTLRDDIRELLAAEMDSLDNDEMSDALKTQMFNRLDRIGYNSFLSFILDFWKTLSEAEQMEVFKFFVALIERKQKQKIQEKEESKP